MALSANRIPRKSVGSHHVPSWPINVGIKFQSHMMISEKIGILPNPPNIKYYFSGFSIEKKTIQLLG